MRREGPSQAYSPNQIRQIKESERIQESLPEKSVLKFLDAEISFFLVLAISSSLYTSRSKDFVPLRNQWIGLRENLLENPEIAWESLWPMVSYRFSLKPIHCRKGKRRKHQEKGMKKISYPSYDAVRNVRTKIGGTNFAPNTCKYHMLKLVLQL